MCDAALSVKSEMPFTLIIRHLICAAPPRSFVSFRVYWDQPRSLDDRSAPRQLPRGKTRILINIRIHPEYLHGSKHLGIFRKSLFKKKKKTAIGKSVLRLERSRTLANRGAP